MIREPQEAQRLQDKYIETRLKMWMNCAEVVYTMGTRQLPLDHQHVMAAYKVAASRNKAQEMREDIAQAYDAFKFLDKRWTIEHYPGFEFDTETFIYVAAMCDNFFEINMLLTYLYLKNCRSFKEMCLKYLPNGYPDISTLRMCWDQQVSDEPEHLDKINLIDCVNSVNTVYKQLHGAR